MGQAATRNLAKNTSRRRKAVGEAKTLAAKFMKKYDASKTGKLNKDEVKAMCDDMLTEYTPLMGGLTDEDINMIMCLGGDTVKPEIEGKDIPIALAIMAMIKDNNKEFNDMFDTFDVDKTGSLDVSQVKALLESAGADVADADVEYVLKQCEPRGKMDPIEKTELKAAVSCWFFLADVKDAVKSEVGDKIKETFKAWDKNGSGTILRDELRAVLKQLQAEMTDKQMDLLFDAIDKNGNGQIEYEEFVDWIMTGAPAAE